MVAATTFERLSRSYGLFRQPSGFCLRRQLPRADEIFKGAFDAFTYEHCRLRMSEMSFAFPARDHRFCQLEGINERISLLECVEVGLAKIGKVSVIAAPKRILVRCRGRNHYRVLVFEALDVLSRVAG